MGKYIKTYLKALIMLSLLNYATCSLSMEKGNTETTDYTLPIIIFANETWLSILEFIYLDHTILSQANDLYEGLANLKRTLFHLTNISLVCRTLHTLKLFLVNEKSLQLYKIKLKEQFLEYQEGPEGLYPQNGTWDISPTADQRIAQFLSTEITEPGMLADILTASLDKDRFKIKQLISVLLFYGININAQNSKGETPLTSAIITHNCFARNNSDIIEMLLAHGADVNMLNKDGNTPLTLTTRNLDRGIQDIIALLLAHEGKIDMPDRSGKTPKLIARELGYTDFEKLIDDLSPNKIQKCFCIII